MDDDKSTPISALNNGNDDSEVVSQVLEKYTNLNDNNRNDHQRMSQDLMPRPSPGGDIMQLDPINPNQRQMEERFENRDINAQLYNMNGQDPMLMQDYQRQLDKSNQYIRSQQREQMGDDEEEYEEYEEIEYVDDQPAWRRTLNEVRIPVIIFIFVFIFFNKNFMVDKFICKYNFFGNPEHYECNWKGVLLKCVIVALFAYITIRFIKI